jgi:hypothetical protein
MRDGYMIGIDQWRRERDDLLAQAGMSAFSSPDQVIKALEAALADQFAKTNSNIAAGANTHVKRMASGHLTLKTPKQEEVEAGTLSRFFPQRHFVPLTEILGTIDGATGFSEGLTHLRRQYARPVQRAVLFAGVIGMGCGIGLRKMGRISGAIKEDALEHAADWALLLREHSGGERSNCRRYGRPGSPRNLSPTEWPDPHGERRPKIRGDGGLARGQSIVQIFRQGPGRQRLHLRR